MDYPTTIKREGMLRPCLTFLLVYSAYISNQLSFQLGVITKLNVEYFYNDGYLCSVHWCLFCSAFITPAHMFELPPHPHPFLVFLWTATCMFIDSCNMNSHIIIMLSHKRTFMDWSIKDSKIHCILHFNDFKIFYCILHCIICGMFYQM